MLVDIPHVGPGTPCGEWFRRYWVVVGTAQELYDIPRAVKVLGEDLGLVSRSIRPSWTTRRALRIAELRWSTAISKMAGCAALTTVGCSTSAVSAWRCQRSRRTASETSVLSRAGTRRSTLRVHGTR